MRGCWIYEEDRRNHWHCSECGHTVGRLGHTYNFCPICGADMREDENYTFTERTKIIRCKDCKHFEKLAFDETKRCQYYGEIGDDHEWGNIDGRFFCGHAERREE